MRRKEERSKQGQTNNKAKQHVHASLVGHQTRTLEYASLNPVQGSSVLFPSIILLKPLAECICLARNSVYVSISFNVSLSTAMFVRRLWQDL